MKRYYVIKKQSANNEHLNEQDLLPASCKLITGIAVCTTVKKDAETVSSTKTIAFPQHLIKKLLNSDSISNLFYSYMRTRSTVNESKEFFETDILPEIVNVLTGGIKYPCLSVEGQSEFSNNLTELLIGGSDQPEIDWEQRFIDLKAEYKIRFFGFLRGAYGKYQLDPENDLNQYFVDSLYSPSTRGYALNRISIEVYYALRNKGYYEPYSTISRNVNTNGNSIMQDYDRRFEQLQNEKQAYEQAETMGLAHYLFSGIGIFDRGKSLSNLAYAELIAGETLSFIHQNKESLFIRPVQIYQRPEPYECGSLSLLVNGNSFLLCDYILTANRKIKHLSKEMIPFSEPLEVNSSLQTVYKSNLKSGTVPLIIRIYIEYEDFKEPLAKVESVKQEVGS